MENRYQFLKTESDMSLLWQQLAIYSFNPNVEAPKFIIDTPPPTVSGKLHIGHVFSYTHADLIARYQRMCGKNVLYPMGFDNNGLPTEKFVTKKRNLRLSELSRTEFINHCLEECGLVEKEFEQLWRSLGLSIDWRQSYSTISPAIRKASQYSFIDLYQKGLVTRKADPFLYCTACQTSVAQAELEWKEKPGKFNTIQFTTATGEALQIATTRPELLPACVAVFYHPDDKRYHHLAGQQAVTPLFNQSVPLLGDISVDPEKGTGLVMCCTFGDQTDVAWYKKHQLPFIQAIDVYGKMTSNAGFLAGLKVDAARAAVLEKLTENGLLLDQKEITHGASVHERCGKEIEYQIIKQWFIKIVEHKQKFLELAEQIEWQPAHMHSRYSDWVANLSWDWCISRQRLFGIPVPAWNCDLCEFTHVPTLAELPVDPLSHQLTIPDCPNCNLKLTPEKDVFDTWATSALTPLIIAGWPDSFNGALFPSTMRPQAHDIIRTWAFYTIVKSYYHTGKLPWEKIVISGHVLAGGKEKISKSKENASNSPEQLIKNYSADAVRFWAGSARLGIDTLFDEGKLKAGLRCSTKLWNALRFVKQHLPADGKKPLLPQAPDALSQWLLHYLDQTLLRYHQLFAANEFSLALETVERFFWQIFCDNYLEIIKDVLFNSGNYEQSLLANIQFCLYQAGLNILQLYAPFMPFVTESLYLDIYANLEPTKSLHQSQFQTTALSNANLDGFASWELLLEVIASVRRLKSEHNLSLKAEVETLHLVCAPSIDKAVLQLEKQLLSGVTKAKEILFSSSDLAVKEQAIFEAEKLEITMSIGFARGQQ